MNINELKKQLQNLGISTSTPGLNGDERFEELSFRLESSQNTAKAVGGTDSINKSIGADSFVVPSLNQLTIGEIRSRLTALGESTATPGVTGEERRVALMRRLIDAVCINDEGTNISSIASTIVADTLKPTPTKKIESPVKVEHKPVSPVSPPAPQIPVEPPAPEIPDIEVTAATISALKNELKRLVNQRAMAVASKLSGSLQDEQLKVCEAKLARIENEIAPMKALLQKGETKLPAESIQSEFLVLNPATTTFAIDSLIARLEGYRSSTKDKIREHRLRIREEGDAHPQFGVAMEEKLKIQLSDANLAATKIPVGKNGVSRARQKLTEVKDLESQLQQQGHIKEAPESPTHPANISGKGSFGGTTTTSASAPVVVGSAGAGASGISVGRAAPGISPKDKAPVHNPANKTTSLDPATLPVSGKSKPLDKWSTDISPNIQPAPARTELPTKAEILASKLPNLTSSFLGKAIDLESGSQKAKSNKLDAHVPATVSAPADMKPPAKPPVKPVEEAPVSVINSEPAKLVSTSTAYVLWPSDEPSSLPSSPPAEEPVSYEPRAEAESTTGPVGSIKVSSVTSAPPVIPGRRPPPPLEGSSSSQKPPGANLIPSVQGPIATAGVPNPSEAEVDAAFDFHIAEFDEDHDEYFREANEAFSHKDARASPAAPLIQEIKDMYPVRRATPKNPTRPMSQDEDDENPFVRQALSMSASRDSDYDNTMAGVYVPEDDNLDDNDYAGLYGSRRRLDTEEEDDDLEELPGSRSSRSPSVRSPLRQHSNNNSDFGDGLSSRLDPLPENQSPLESRSGSRDESQEEHEGATENTHHAHGPPIHHLPSIDEDDDTKSEKLHASPSPQRSKRPIYNLAGNLENPDDEQETNVENTETNDNKDKEDEDGERLGDEKIQIRVLRSHAKVLEGLNDVAAAEAVHMRALELDPTNISTLEGFAQFLHQKKGELARAEAFFNRGLQVCLPGLVLKTGDSAKNTPQSGRKSISRMSFSTDGTMQGSKIKHIIKFILSYAHFLSKAKGDIEAASILYKKGVDLCPEDALLLATYAHFLAQLGDKDSNNAAAEYFQRALKISPGNAQYAMWYGKLLKKMGKTGQAELMYKVALERSKGNEALEPTAMCNYATFVFKQRRDPERAHVLFQAGLAVYPNHKGLRKNYAALVKAHPQFASGDAPVPVKRESKSASDRAQRLAQSAMDSINEEAKPPPSIASEDEEESS